VTQAGAPEATVSIQQAAKAIGYGTRTTYNLVKLKRLRVVRVGRKMRVPVVEINAFLQREMEANQ
jgi:excisionase family DNA binding protein